MVLQGHKLYLIACFAGGLSFITSGGMLVSWEVSY